LRCERFIQNADAKQTGERAVNIDQLVAEKVMEWTLVDREKRGWGDAPPVYHINQDVDEPYFQDFRPSTNLYHAWMVVEHFKALEPPLRIGSKRQGRCISSAFRMQFGK
jgi:hypothetical protein